jgi:lipoprotein-anchoring transpeptidase ErfK/SrfK
MFLRLATAIALMLGLAAFASQAAAQIVIGPPPGAYYAPPPGAVPPPDDDDDDDDVVRVAPPVQMQPLPPPGSMAGPALPPRPGIDPRVPAAPVELTAPARPQPAPPVASARPSFGGTSLRPPADIHETTGSIQSVAPAAPQGDVVSSLPPEDQPEIGQPKELPPHLRRQTVEYWTKEPTGTLIIDTPNTYLYLVLGNGKAMRYGIGVGREGFTWAGVEKITKVAEWPDWFPPAEMIERQPYLPRFMAGGETNPLGARALYLGKTVYRIHGTNQPSTIGTFVSSGCIRLVNDDIQDLYQRVKVGTRVVVLPSSPAAPAARGPATTAPTASNPLPQTR